MSLRIKRGDTVQVISGAENGKTGKVLRIDAGIDRIIVENINIRKKHMRKRRQEDEAGIVPIPAPIHISNVALYCTKCKKGVRFKTNVLEDKTKVRICAKCGAQL